MTTVNQLFVNYVKRVIPKRGVFSSDNYNASVTELAVDLTHLQTRWNSEAYPILYSLPRGTDDPRTKTSQVWVNAGNMPDVYDATTGGLHGDTLMIDNHVTNADTAGLLWDTSNDRPVTIKEAVEYVNTRLETEVAALETSIANVDSGLETAAWNRLGTWVRDGGSSPISGGSSVVDAIVALEALIAGGGSDTSDILTFIGAISGDTVPTYSSSIYASGSLETAIGGLDAQLVTTTNAGTTATTNISNLRVASGVGAGATSVDLSGRNYFTTTPSTVTLKQALIDLDTNIYTDISNTYTAIGIADGATSLTLSSDKHFAGSETVTAAFEILDDDLDTIETAANGHIATVTGNPHVVTLAEAAAVYLPYDVGTHPDPNPDITIRNRLYINSDIAFASSGVFNECAIKVLPWIAADNAYTSLGLATDSAGACGVSLSAKKVGAGPHLPQLVVRSHTAISGSTGTTIFSITDAGAAVFAGTVNMANYQINLLAEPTLSTDAATKNYVDTSINVAHRYQQNFTNHTDENIPITVTYGSAGDPMPLVQVIDRGVGTDYGVLADENYVYEQEHGIATSDEFISIDYRPDGTFDVYTSIVNGIILYVI